VTNARCSDGHWDKNNRQRYEIMGKRIGVLGLGNIGRAVARACAGLGMEVSFFDTRQVSLELGQEMGWRAAGSVEELFRSVDYLTVHLSAQDVFDHSNEGLLTAEVLSQLAADRPDSSPRIFLNLSRGFLHTADALRAAVASGAILQAAVDVYPSEPRGGEDWVNPYHDLPQIAVTPHIGASTQEAQPRIAARVSATFRDFSRHGSLRDCVFRPRMTVNLSGDITTGSVALAVVHGTARGTKRAIDDAIYRAGASNLSSVHKDFVKLGVAYDLALIDRPLSDEQLAGLVEAAAEITGEPDAIRSIRQILL
jgi:D-3-phosphoglycerate dehydrogenase